MNLEIEVKFPVEGFDVPRAALHAAGAIFVSRVFERNVVFDTPDGSLRARGALLRLRRAGASKVTLKLPAEGEVPAGFKARRELETPVGDFEACAAIFTLLGYKEFLRYEKFRETWRHLDAKVCFDELPFGRFIEVEGSPQTIEQACAVMDLPMSRALTSTYHDLHLADCDARGLPRHDSFVFPEAARKRYEALRA